MMIQRRSLICSGDPRVETYYSESDFGPKERYGKGISAFILVLAIVWMEPHTIVVRCRILFEEGAMILAVTVVQTGSLLTTNVDGLVRRIHPLRLDVIVKSTRT